MIQHSSDLQEGFTILIIGISIVFLSLILLHQVFEYVVPYFISVLNKKKKAADPELTTSIKKTSAEDIVAATAAVYAFLEEIHDEENAVITIGKSSKSYSPWNSKIYVTHRLNSGRG